MSGADGYNPGLGDAAGEGFGDYAGGEDYAYAAEGYADGQEGDYYGQGEEYVEGGEYHEGFAEGDEGGYEDAGEAPEDDGQGYIDEDGGEGEDGGAGEAKEDMPDSRQASAAAGRRLSADGGGPGSRRASLSGLEARQRQGSLSGGASSSAAAAAAAGAAGDGSDPFAGGGRRASALQAALAATADEDMEALAQAAGEVGDEADLGFEGLADDGTGADHDGDDEDEDGGGMGGDRDESRSRGRKGSSDFGAIPSGKPGAGGISERDLVAARHERDQLRATHQARERKVLLVWALDPSGKKREALSHYGDSRGSGGRLDQVRNQYHKSLDTVATLWDRLDQRREAADAAVEKLTDIVDELDEQQTTLNNAFKVFKREIASEAKNSRTGKPIPKRQIFSLEDDEEKVDKDLAEARLKFITLKNQLARLEKQIKQKDELAEGLHLIDFEQIKIENAALHDQIEERSDQLHKLRKKTIATVQVLTHIKEKLEFVRQEYRGLENQLRGSSDDVVGVRDTVTRTKHARDMLRADNAALKQRQGFIGSDMLVADFETRKGDLVQFRSEVEQLKDRYRELHQFVSAANQEAARSGVRGAAVAPVPLPAAGSVRPGGRGGVTQLPPVRAVGRH